MQHDMKTLNSTVYHIQSENNLKAVPYITISTMLTEIQSLYSIWYKISTLQCQTLCDQSSECNDSHHVTDHLTMDFTDWSV